MSTLLEAQHVVRSLNDLSRRQRAVAKVGSRLTELGREIMNQRKALARVKDDGRRRVAAAADTLTTVNDQMKVAERKRADARVAVDAAPVDGADLVKRASELRRQAAAMVAGLLAEADAMEQKAAPYCVALTQLEAARAAEAAVNACLKKYRARLHAAEADAAAAETEGLEKLKELELEWDSLHRAGAEV